MYPLDELKFENVPQNDWNNKPKLAYNARHKGFGVAFEKQEPTKRAEWLQAYLACISFADAQFGMILDALEESGQADNTIVVMHSDHGFHIGEHFLYGKVTLFEESTRVPLMIRTPKMKKPGHKSSSLVELVDIFPTLTDLCGLPSPDHLQGKSLGPILDDPDASIKDTAYTVVTRGPKVIGKCLHHEQWRYTDWDGKQQAELYNLEKDPSEHNNLIDKPEFAKVVKVMQEKLVDRHL
jgi:iduronate 2-sulfatase